MKLSLKQALSDIKILANKISISEENLIVEGTCRYFLREFFFFLIQLNEIPDQLDATYTEKFPL